LTSVLIDARDAASPWHHWAKEQIAEAGSGIGAAANTVAVAEASVRVLEREAFPQRVSDPRPNEWGCRKKVLAALRAGDKMMIMLPIPKMETPRGKLYEGDCLSLLPTLSSETVDLVFADPPFNLGKEYSSMINDSVPEEDYLSWSKRWLDELVRVMRPGGALFLFNLPKWNLHLGAFLSEKLTFRHWIAVDIKYSLPVPKRLYPSHYSLLYFIKGAKPGIFHPDRLPIKTCSHCGKEANDYGGYKDKMNPAGVNLADVWYDIPPVRHSKYKKREANELSLKLMDRVVCMASDPGSTVLDPFGGSGTTFVAAELLGRNWIGIEMDASAIIRRFEHIEEDESYLARITSGKNVLFTPESLKLRKRFGHDTSRYRLNGPVEGINGTALQPTLF
jgi:site-specific DNA-methyltransferase (adenine-specific)